MHYLLSILIILFVACSKGTLNPEPEGKCGTWLKDSALFNTPSKEEFTVQSLEYKNGCLAVKAAYGGGCLEFQPLLVWDGLEGTSRPPTFEFKLYTDQEDNCKAIAIKTWHFLISNISASKSKIIKVNNQTLTLND